MGSKEGKRELRTVSWSLMLGFEVWKMAFLEV